MALGMDWPTLKQARPGVQHGVGSDHLGAAEYFYELNDSGRIAYFFSDSVRPDTMFSRPLPRGVLSSIQINPRGVPRGDTVAYRKLVTSIITHWDSLVGPSESVYRCSLLTPGGKPYPLEWRTWRRQEVALLLLATPDDALRPEPLRDATWLEDEVTQRHSVAMVVQSTRLPLGLGTIFEWLGREGRCAPAERASERLGAALIPRW